MTNIQQYYYIYKKTRNPFSLYDYFYQDVAKVIRCVQQESDTHAPKMLHYLWMHLVLTNELKNSTNSWNMHDIVVKIMDRTSNCKW